MTGSAWRDAIERAQQSLRDHPDRCFVCGRAVPADCPRCTVEAFLDDARRQRLAVVCEQRSCATTLADPRRDTWRDLFGALDQWPDPALYPLGPYWTIRRGQRFTFRTEQRRTAYRG